MTKAIVTQERRSFKALSRDEMILFAHEWLEARRGLGGAQGHECLVGYVDEPRPFTPIYVEPGKLVEGEAHYCWFVEPGVGRCDRIAYKLLEGSYACAQTGLVFEWPAEWVLSLGVVSAKGDWPLLTLDMVRGGRDG